MTKPITNPQLLTTIKLIYIVGKKPTIYVYVPILNFFSVHHLIWLYDSKSSYFLTLFHVLKLRWSDNYMYKFCLYPVIKVAVNIQRYM